MLRSSDLQEGVRVLLILLALLAEVVVRVDTALVPDPSDRVGVASVADNAFVLHCRLVGSPLGEMLNHHPLEGLGTVGLDVFSHDLNHLLDELASDLPSAIALPAGVAPLAHFGSQALVALDGFGVFHDLFGLVLASLDDVAAHLLVFPDDILLAALLPSGNLHVAPSVVDVLGCLGSNLVHLDGAAGALGLSLEGFSSASDLSKINQILSFSGLIDPRTDLHVFMANLITIDFSSRFEHLLGGEVVISLLVHLVLVGEGV